MTNARYQIQQKKNPIGSADAPCVVCAQESNEAVERVLAVEVLHLMRSPGAYSVSVGDMLGGSEVWQAYKHQKHDLFLPAAANPSVSKQHDGTC